MMHPDKKDAYDYTLRDFEGSLGCPQCRARKLLEAVKRFQSPYCKGQAQACLVVLSEPHECGLKELGGTRCQK